MWSGLSVLTPWGNSVHLGLVCPGLTEELSVFLSGAFCLSGVGGS